MQYNEYKTWLQGINSQGKQPAPMTDEQMASDLRIKGYITHAVQDDNILAKMIGMNIISNGYMDDALAQLYFIDRFSKGIK